MKIDTLMACLRVRIFKKYLFLCLVCCFHYSLALEDSELEILKEWQLRRMQSEDLEKSRYNFEYYSLSYVEDALRDSSGFDQKLGLRQSLERCDDLLEMKYFEFPYKADVLRAIYLMKTVSRQRGELLALLSKVSDEDSMRGDMRIFESLMECVVFYHYHSIEAGMMDDAHAAEIEKFIEDHKQYIPVELKKVFLNDQGKVRYPKVKRSVP